jgi:hypothetical protein
MYAGYMTHIVREFCASHLRDMRQIQAGCASHPLIRRNCCAHLPREERATRDVTFELLFNCAFLAMSLEWQNQFFNTDLFGE